MLRTVCRSTPIISAASATSRSRAVEQFEDQRLPGREQARGNADSRRQPRFDGQPVLRHRVEIEVGRLAPAHVVDDRAAGNHRQPSREGGPRGIIAAQEAEIRLAETQENLLHRVVHLVRPGRSAQAVLHGGEDDPRIALDESVPSLLVATRERLQINTKL